MRERALAQRHVVKKEVLTIGSKHLPPLSMGDTVMVQDQSTHKPGRWTKTGKIVEVHDFDSYLIKIDGSNTVTKRNRKFLRKIATFIDNVAGPSPHDDTSAVATPTISTPPPRPSPPPQASPPSPAVSLPSKIAKPIDKPRKKILKEKWIVAKPKPNTPVPHHAPPPPGTKHNYSAMDDEALHLREMVKSSLLK